MRRRQRKAGQRQPVAAVEAGSLPGAAADPAVAEPGVAGPGVAPVPGPAGASPAAVPGRAPLAVVVPGLWTPEGRGLLDRAVTRLATWSLRLLAITAGVALLAWVVLQLWTVVLPTVLAVLLATILWPPVRQMRTVMPDALAAALAMLGMLGLLGGLVAIIVPRITGQVQELAGQVSGGLRTIQQFVNRSPEDFLESLPFRVPFTVDTEQFSRQVDVLVARMQSVVQDVALGVLGGLSSVGSGIVTAVLALVLCFLFLKDGPKFGPWLSDQVGTRAGAHLPELLGRTWGVLGGYIRSQALVAFIDAVLIGVGLAVLDIPFALPLAVLVFFGGFLPFIGAILTGSLAALVALVSHGWVRMLVVIALVLIVQQLESNVFQPYLVGKIVSLHPAVVILAVTAGGTLLGIAGAFLAVPVAAVVATVYRYIKETSHARMALAPPGEHPPPLPDAR
ncbi:putative PurR-regulated permease PerM [Kineococcus xinjiangensis]|uniref:Putative PurR-regulated permease PerM n=1 Tax=Kineococcus xinjiangensis TaxID=512762 RepID=A0A2S6IG41_9ACTN|nr:AI-2E family transporter [Kineococcus xinjiangensis]PPK93173.1 putative PurR-regulated permease PerM [Kineococcus xinjiangensis]